MEKSSKRQQLTSIITSTMIEVSQEQGLPLVSLTDDTVLLQSGLDSLGFAIVISKLDMTLGYDPFLMEQSFYPRTLRDLIDIYERHAKNDSL